MKICLLATLLAFAVAVSAEDNTPPKVSLELPKTAKAGKTVKATVFITFAEGLHGYANPPTKDYLIPTSIQVETKGVTLASATYPKGKPETVPGEDKPVGVYEGKISIPVVFKMPKKGGKLNISIDVHYQQCNASSCYPPGDIKSTAVLTVVK